MKTYMPIPALKRIGYHTIIDDCVTSFCVPKSGAEAVIDGLKQDWNIDHIWTRDDLGNVDYYCDTKFGSF